MDNRIADDQETFLKKVRAINLTYARVAFVFAVALILFISFMFVGQWAHIFIILLLTLFGLAFHVTLFKCPNCGRYFFFRIPFLAWFAEIESFFRKECVNCGFPRVTFKPRKP